MLLASTLLVGIVPEACYELESVTQVRGKGGRSWTSGLYLAGSRQEDLCVDSLLRRYGWGYRAFFALLAKRERTQSWEGGVVRD